MSRDPNTTTTFSYILTREWLISLILPPSKSWSCCFLLRTITWKWRLFSGTARFRLLSNVLDSYEKYNVGFSDFPKGYFEKSHGHFPRKRLASPSVLRALVSYGKYNVRNSHEREETWRFERRLSSSFLPPFRTRFPAHIGYIYAVPGGWKKIQWSSFIRQGKITNLALWTRFILDWSC